MLYKIRVNKYIYNINVCLDIKSMFEILEIKNDIIYVIGVIYFFCVCE